MNLSVTLHRASDRYSLLLIQQMLYQFTVLGNISTPKSDVTVCQTLWNVRLHALPLCKPVRARQTTSYAILYITNTHSFGRRQLRIQSQ